MRVGRKADASERLQADFNHYMGCERVVKRKLHADDAIPNNLAEIIIIHTGTVPLCGTR